VLQSFDFSGGKDFAAHGRTFTYQATNAAELGADERIAVEVNGQPLGDFYVGDSITLPQAANRWSVRPYAAGLRGYVLIGEGQVSTNRTGRAVAVVGGGLETTLQGRRFWGQATRSGTAAVFSVCGVWNKDPTRSLAVHSISLIGNGLGSLRWAVGSLPATIVSQTAMRSKRLGAAASTRTDLVAGNSAAYPPATPADFATIDLMGSLILGAKTPWPVDLKCGPLILGPSSGLWGIYDTVNLALSIEFEVEELTT
jgi:hypothetical protein